DHRGAIRAELTVRQDADGGAGDVPQHLELTERAGDGAIQRTTGALRHEAGAAERVHGQESQAGRRIVGVTHRDAAKVAVDVDLGEVDAGGIEESDVDEAIASACAADGDVQPGACRRFAEVDLL